MSEEGETEKLLEQGSISQHFVMCFPKHYSISSTLHYGYKHAAKHQKNYSAKGINKECCTTAETKWTSKTHH